jgi:dipeptidyl aminopeptidase/acylaminoacyl peptidase
MKTRHAPLLLALLLVGCDFTYAEPESLGTVGGVDMDALFRAPSSGEIAAVTAEWASRDVSVQGFQREMTDQATFGGLSMRVEVVSHLVTGLRHYGAFLIPDGASVGSTAIMMYLHGGDAGISVDGEVGLVTQFFGDVTDDFIYVIPSFRDEAVRYNGRTWKSEGPPSPWDYDVDDAMALLSAAIENVPEADPTRIASFGMSRGAGVGLLMSARDPRVERVLDFFGPTDFFGPFVQDVATEALNGSPRNLPGLDYLNETFLTPLSSGQLRIEDLRPELVRRSAVLFVDRIAATQVHHGLADTVVPATQAQRLMDAMETAGKRAPDFEGFLYEGGEHNPITLPGAFESANVFLKTLLANG